MTDDELSSEIGGQNGNNGTNMRNVETDTSRMRKSMVTENVCTFKRGGKCILHGTIGTKNVGTKKVWSKLKGGLFGYKYVRNTTYTCKERNSSSGIPDDLNSPTRKQSDIALGRDTDDEQWELHLNSEISGGGIRGAGASTENGSTKTETKDG